MTSRRESLQGKLAKLQAEVQEEQQREAAEKAMAEAHGHFADNVRLTVQNVEAGTKTSLRDLGLGVWAYYDPEGALEVQVLPVGDDQLPRRAPARRSGRRQRAADGYQYFLQDGRGPFNNTLEALDALGIPQEQRGRYYHRWDRLPKELQEQIERRARAGGEA
jgi:hypothetical protein